MTEKTDILVVEDEKQIARFLQMELEHEGYSCCIEYNGAAALDRIGQEQFDIILLDIMLPDIDGLTICRHTRQMSDVPIIMVSAKDDIETKVSCLDAGANDYITKPFNSKELFARIRVLLRDRKKQSRACLHLQDLTLYLNDHDVIIGEDKHVSLTKKEFQLLLYLIRNKNVVLSRERIVEEVWGYDYIGDTNVVDVYIGYIRGKLGRPVADRYIRTVRGVGYVAKD